MLYVTTRDSQNPYTPLHALTKERGECGGFYIPLRLPAVGDEVLNAFSARSFGQRIADILNIFFRTELNGREISLAIGRLPTRIAVMNHKIAIMENWHNPDGDYSNFLVQLYGCTMKKAIVPELPSTWFRVTARIACLFAAFADLERVDITTQYNTVDIALTENCVEDVVAAIYAKKMGLPVGKIVLACSEDGGLWDLLHYGALETEKALALSGLEMAVFEILGHLEARRFADACNRREIYRLREEQMLQLNKVLFCTVVRPSRVTSIIHNVYHTNAYLMDSVTASAYGGLQDYRASHKETDPALIISDRMPSGVIR